MEKQSLKEAVLLCCDMIAMIPRSDKEAWNIHTSVWESDGWDAYAYRKINGMGDALIMHRVSSKNEQLHYEVRLDASRKSRLDIPPQTGTTPAEAISKLKKYLEDKSDSYKFVAAWILI